MPKLAVLVSGSGSNLRAIIRYPLDVELVIADRECFALDIAAYLGIRIQLIDRARFAPFDEDGRENFSHAVADALRSFGAGDVVAMAGFRTVLSPHFFREFQGTLLNLHPSLLPAFKGPRAVRDTLAAGVTETGCTVHIATMVLDDGPILAQARVGVLQGDTEATLHARIKAAERRFYPMTIAKVLQGHLGRR